MTDVELKERLKPFIDALESRLSIRASIINNAGLLLALRAEGFKVDDLLDLTGCTYSRQSFSSALYQAKKKIKNTDKPVVEGELHSPQSPSIEKEQTQTIDTEEWIAAFNFSQPVRDTPVLHATIDTLSKAGWNKRNYHILRSELSITTLNKLIDAVSIMQSSKFRKNIFKDNQACF